MAPVDIRSIPDNVYIPTESPIRICGGHIEFLPNWTHSFMFLFCSTPYHITCYWSLSHGDIE